MSQENVEIMLAAYDAYERIGVEGIIRFLDEDIEWRNLPDSPGAGVFHGPEGVREWHRQVGEVWAEMHFEPTNIDELPDGRLLASVRARVKARAEGVELEGPFAHLIEMRAGKLVAFRMYANVEAALKAVGLEE